MQSENLNLRPWIIVAVLPLIAMALYVLMTLGLNRNRYDAAYFTPEITGTYDTPGAVVKALEAALATQDTEALAELQGLREPQTLATSTTLKFQTAMETEGRYLRFLFSDERNYHRSMQFVTEVDGRYVAAPQDAYFYLRSGRWLGFFMPIAGVWWLIELLAFAMTRFNRRAVQRRAALGV